MTVSSISGSDWTNYSTNSTDSTDEQLSEFFTLLLAQMQNQDPMEPMSNEEMMAQFAQLTTVQELQNLTSAVEDMTTASALSDATTLIGKTIIATDDNDNTISGTVDMVYISDGGDVTLNVNGEEVSLEFVDVVYDGDNTMNSSLESLASSSALSYASSLIGKYIEAEVEVTDDESEEDTETDDDEEDEVETTTISGIVESVEITDEGIVMFLDNDEQVLLADVVRVMQSAPAEDETTTEDTTTDDTTSTESTSETDTSGT